MFTPKHMSAEQLRAYYAQPLEKLEAIILQDHMRRLLDPDYAPSAEEAEQHAVTLRRVELLEADLKRALCERED